MLQLWCIAYRRIILMDTVNKLDKLLNLNVNEFTDKKGGFTYLSWATAWREFIKVYPDAVYEIKKNENGLPIFGDSKVGYMCYTTVTANNLTHEMWMPVLDFKNKAMLTPNMFDVNKSVMRCLTKTLAMFGLGLYIYAGEDLPDDESLEESARIEIFKMFKNPKFSEEYKNGLIADMKAKIRTYQSVLEELKKHA